MSQATPPPLGPHRRTGSTSSVGPRLLAALRRAAAWSFAPPRWLSSSLGDYPAIVWALLLTLTTYAMLNTWLIGRVQRAYANLTLVDIRQHGDAPRSAEYLLRRYELPRRDDVADRLAKALGTQGARPGPEILHELLHGLAGAPGEASAQRTQQTVLRDELTGQIRNLRFGWLAATLPSGERLVARLEAADPSLGKKLEDKSNVQHRLLFVKLTDALGERMQPSLRALMLINGWVQWFTVALFWLILVVVGRRLFVLWRVQKQPAESVAIPFDLAALARELPSLTPTARSSRLDGVRRSLDGQVYGALGFLLGALPSLGFIGTVQGMGAALLKANGLFTSADKQETVSLITQDLGFAFDTTLVALVLSIVAGLAMVLLRGRELAWLDQFETAPYQDSPTIVPAREGEDPDRTIVVASLGNGIPRADQGIESHG